MSSVFGDETMQLLEEYENIPSRQTIVEEADEIEIGKLTPKTMVNPRMPTVSDPKTACALTKSLARKMNRNIEELRRSERVSKKSRDPVYHYNPVVKRKYRLRDGSSFEFDEDDFDEIDNVYVKSTRSGNRYIKTYSAANLDTSGIESLDDEQEINVSGVTEDEHALELGQSSSEAAQSSSEAPKKPKRDNSKTMIALAAAKARKKAAKERQKAGVRRSLELRRQKKLEERMAEEAEEEMIDVVEYEERMNTSMDYEDPADYNLFVVDSEVDVGQSTSQQMQPLRTSTPVKSRSASPAPVTTPSPVRVPLPPPKSPVFAVPTGFAVPRLPPPKPKVIPFPRSASIAQCTPFTGELNESNPRFKAPLPQIVKKESVKQEIKMGSVKTNPSESIPQVSTSVSPMLRSLEIGEKKISRPTHKYLVTSIRSIMRTLEVPMSGNLERRFAQIAETLDGFDVSANLVAKIEVFELQTAISSCLFSLSRSRIQPTIEGEKGISLRDLVLQLQTMIFSMDPSIVSDYEQKLKQMIDMFNLEDKKIPVEKVQSALASIIDIIAP